MDYEKKYKSLVEAVKTLKEANPSDEGIQNWVKDNVPELRESENEKNKRIIKDIKYILAKENFQEEVETPYVEMLACDKRANRKVFRKVRLVMAKYRIEHRYPYYNGCIPIDIWVVQRLQRGFFSDKWVDIKGFDTPERAEELLKILE